MRLVKMFNKCSNLEKILVIVILIILFHKLYLFLSGKNNTLEGFDTTDPFKLKTNDSLYDSFYCSIYDELTYSKNRVKFEVDEIIKKTALDKNKAVLDIGSGTGHTVAQFNTNGIPVIGIDKSPSMVKLSRHNYKKLNYFEGDAQNPHLFKEDTFTHMTCLNYTIYYIKNKDLFFENMAKWLMPGGYLIVHLVNKSKAVPFVSASYNGNNGENIVPFDNMEYSNTISHMESVTTITETIRSKQNIRQNEHTLYMPDERDIVKSANKYGFSLKEKIDMKQCKFNYQYLYVFQNE